MMKQLKTYKFFRKEKKAWEKVEPVLWRWEAHYKDKTILKQYDDKGIFHQLSEIKQFNLRFFVMKNAENGKKLSVVFPENARIVHFYRNYILNYGYANQKNIRVFVFGYEKDNYRYYLMIMPSGDILIIDNFKNKELLKIVKTNYGS